MSREPLVPKDTPLADALNSLFLRRVWREPARDRKLEDVGEPKRGTFMRPEAGLDPEGPGSACEECGNDAHGRYCSICSDPTRDRRLMMVVGSPADIRDQEQSRSEVFNGIYHVQPPLADTAQRHPFNESLSRLRARLRRNRTVRIFLRVGTGAAADAEADVLRSALADQGAEIFRYPPTFDTPVRNWFDLPEESDNIRGGSSGAWGQRADTDDDDPPDSLTKK